MKITTIKTLVAGTCALALISHVVSADVTEKPTVIRFNQQIRPLLSDYCFKCHGPDSASRQAELRLDTREGAMEHDVIVPGSARESELIARIRSDDPQYMMPPPESPKRLSPDEQRLLACWIDAGAHWQAHWAFIKPRKSLLPRPEGADGWARNDIDYFVFNKLQGLGLRPNDEADRHVLARRAALDVTGLPPDEEMLQAFLSDAQESAFARYVDGLLKSEHAGEHRARYWLDAARYGDTHGMHVDNFREIWPYRDWVIRAFHTNMPFDQFVINQIAGDLLPGKTLDQQIATGFSRCNITTSEGGAISEELDARYMVDRVETTATVFLGLTAGCAVCHDHKFDPLTQREFYQLGAFFNNTTQPAMDGNQKDTPPVVVLPGVEFQDEWYALQARRKALRTELDEWKSPAEQWWTSHPRSADHPVATDELVLWLPLTEGQDDTFQLPDSAHWATGHPAGQRGVRFAEESELTVDLPTLRSDEPFAVSFWFRTPDRVIETTLFKQMKKTDDQSVGWGITSNAQGSAVFELFDANGRGVRGVLPDNDALRPRSWQHVCVRYSGGQSNSSISILANGRTASLRNSSESLIEASELANTRLKIASNLRTAGLSDVRIFRRWVSDEEAQLLSQDHVLNKYLASDDAWDELDPEARDLLTKFYKHVVDKDFLARSLELSASLTRHDYIYSRSTTTLVMQERPSPPRAWVLERGEYTKRREQVSPGVPSVLPSIPGNAPRNRLGLAQWLVHPDHPLTARVMVNRLWQSVFGVGLVKTSEDFGVMGDRPTHPELLDWLAVEFVESGWNVNHILKLILTSGTYRQSSAVVAEKLHLDPDNRYLSHGSRLRLDAEVLRDQALAVSGLLRREIGGPSVKTYQPAGLWKVVAIVGSNTGEFQRDSGDALYRRSLYTFWKRTSPPPSLAAFNAPTREQCTVRRERTNTPLQALVMMNDVQFVESARHLAETALQQLADERERASWMIIRVFSRPAKEIETMEMASAAAEFLAMFQQNAAAANELILTGESTPDATLDAAELAAWTMVANTIMNSDEFINK